MSENDIPLSTWKAAEIRVEKLDHMDVIWEYLCAKLTLLSEFKVSQDPKFFDQW